MKFIDAIETRRSIYKFEPKITIGDNELVNLVKSATKHVPTPYNMQSNVTLLLLGDESKKLWNIVMEALSGIVDPDKFANTEAKINDLATSYGTVLFFINDDIVTEASNNMPDFEGGFSEWGIQANAMLQYTVWSLLTQEGLGATLQHYNPIIDDKVRETWKIPGNLILKAQMPFGIPDFTPGEKDFANIDERFYLFD